MKKEPSLLELMQEIQYTKERQAVIDEVSKVEANQDYIDLKKFQEEPNKVVPDPRTFGGKTLDEYVPGDDDIFEKILKRHDKLKQEAYDRSMKGIE